MLSYVKKTLCYAAKRREFETLSEALFLSRSFSTFCTSVSITIVLCIVFFFYYFY